MLDNAASMCYNGFRKGEKVMRKMKSDIEIIQSIRRNWGMVKPYSRIEKNKKAYSRKQKHKGKWE